MAPCCAASTRVSFGGGVMAIEDVILLGMHPDASGVEAAIATASPGNPADGYASPPKRYSEITKVTVTTVARVPELIAAPDVAAMLEYQAGQLEYAVAALAIWMTTDAGQYLCKRLPIWKVKLADWDAVVKPFAVECRRMGQIFGTGEGEIDHAFAMRKLTSLMGRSDADADWTREVGDRTTDTSVKYAYYDGQISTDAYRRIRDYTLDAIVQSAMPELKQRSGSFGEYILERWWNMPRGTSSSAAMVKSLLKLEENEVLDLQLRPIKPVVYEARSVSDILAEAAVMPTAHARGSTKPEPGYKCRALLAVDDATAFIAGYASQRIETVTKYAGMVLRQDPADVSEWVNFDIGPDVWRVSNDYSNFNILNSLRSMQLIDLKFAEAWRRVPFRWARDKQMAHAWVAASYACASFHCINGRYLATAGLWSGHRNTARDNTMLHVCYLNAVKSVMWALLHTHARSGKQRVCGDDETLAYNEWCGAVLHTLVADGLGYTSQVAKGMLSRRHDEFLQLIRLPGRPPKYPVAHTILTFCSGNWYKDPVRDVSTTVKDVSDHLWDMVLGGVPLRVAQRLGCSVLDYLMQVKDEEGSLVALEWWDFRGCDLPEGHPLWGCIQTVANPVLADDLDVGSLPSHATDASLLREAEAWRAIDPATRARVRRQRLTTAYRNVAKNALTRQYDEKVQAVWPRRHVRPYTLPDSSGLPAVQANRWRAVPGRLVARSARAVAVQVKFPPELLDTPDMWKAMITMTPRARSTMLLGLEEQQKPTRGWRWWLPPLLRVI